ncbi:hypothetical protein TgHK011_003597 [Trichoderma gracile]|nr:hypothetical protein TgHK011_003597 [Trichoderma gracile]
MFKKIVKWLGFGKRYPPLPVDDYVPVSDPIARHGGTRPTQTAPRPAPQAKKPRRGARADVARASRRAT